MKLIAIRSMEENILLCYRKWFIMIAVASCLLIQPAQPAMPVQAAPVPDVWISIKTSPASEAETKLHFRSSRKFDPLAHAAHRGPVPFLPVTDTYVTIGSEEGGISYWVDQEGNLYNSETKEKFELKKKDGKKLLDYAAYARSAHYGELIPWNDAKQLIPKKAKFKVTDMETGLSFHVQRRAGSSHADVQPLTKQDTAIMKKIYNGKWSWKRKAILVQTGDRQLAASMHGMPHGGDGIPDNDFSGHFCIHFLGSTTHGKGNLDPDHQLMLRKAAGKAGEFLNQASPNEVADTFLIALKMREQQLMRMSFSQANETQLEYFLKEDAITGINKKLPRPAKITKDMLTVDIPVDLSITREGRREQRCTYTFHMVRESASTPWKIGSITMIS
ncbi:hypothetical protein [Paenibacillus thalictri]|uniref:Uncharacterized protein n=1 Tax=Paenibacillus thalictri TaxID=2527873 RepID=A0A4Q9DL62_9BACL|nr:hypothetical protein [Paenibacillus thalictri]TBL75701.1 hypothetical protein EYB31_22165 [Paenibacillus thalictri]